MALIANYTDLKTAVAEWLIRTGDTAVEGRADEFIALFEAEFLLDPEMRTFEMEEIDTATLSGAATALPDGFLQMIRIQITNLSGGISNQTLTYISPQSAGILDATQSTSGTPKNYTVLAGQIFVSPQKWVPTGATLELAYYKFAALSGSNATNWLLTKYPNIYLYGALMQCAAYIDDKEAVSEWSTGLAAAMGKLSKSDRKRKIGSGPLVIRPQAGFIR